VAPSPIEDPYLVPAHGGVDRDICTDVGSEQRLRQRGIDRDVSLFGVRFDGVDQDDVTAVSVIELKLDLVAQLDDVGILGHGIDSDRSGQGSLKPGDPILETQSLRKVIVLVLGPVQLLLQFGESEPVGSETDLETDTSVGRENDHLPSSKRT